MAVLGAFLPAQAQTKILFVGNSFTHGGYAPVLNYNAAAITDENFGLPPSSPRYESDPGTPGPWGGVPGIFKKLADQAGLSYEVHIEAMDGTALEDHYNNALCVIQQPKWNIVVLQERSTLPLPNSRGGRRDIFINYINQLEQAIHGVNPLAQVYLYQTWARADLTYPAGSNYAGLPIDSMSDNLHSGYYQALAQNPKITAVAPAGDAWLRAIRANVAMRNPYAPTPGRLNLWYPDSFHPSKWGAYLNACVLFYQITGTDPRLLGATELAAAGLGITGADAVVLQQIAYLQVKAASPLPVVLTAFGAVRQPTGGVLRWSTASEKDNARFEVQRSLDGRDFATIATVPGHGSTAQPHDYISPDPTAPANQLYYRLRQVDSDGAAVVSPVATVGKGATFDCIIFPNPAGSYISFATPSATAYQVLNQFGQRLLAGTTEAGIVTLQIEMLPPGLYYLALQASSGKLVRKFVK
jgi:hypothetical protein